MSPLNNPFSPGAGSPPPELVGREDVLQHCEILLARTLKGRPEKSVLLTGLRGVGKTVLLNVINGISEDNGYLTIQIEAHEGKKLGPLLTNAVRSLLLKLDRLEGAKDKLRRSFAVLKSFIGSVKVNYEDLSFGLDIEPERGTADSGDIEIDLPEVLVALAEVAREKEAAIAILIDELQYFDEKELSALIMAMHQMQQKQLPLVLIGAGLPILPRLAGESKSYAERLFLFPKIGPLELEEAERAIEEPILSEDATISKKALSEIALLTQGYPYFIQEWGYQVWNNASSKTITESVIPSTTRQTLHRLDENFFRVRFDRLTPAEKKFLRAMAELGPGPYRIAEIAEVMGTKVGSLSPRRAKMIHKAMIYSPTYGDLAFTVPMFDEFMRREIPDFKSM